MHPISKSTNSNRFQAPFFGKSSSCHHGFYHSQANTRTLRSTWHIYMIYKYTQLPLVSAELLHRGHEHTVEQLARDEIENVNKNQAVILCSATKLAWSIRCREKWHGATLTVRCVELEWTSVCSMGANVGWLSSHAWTLISI